ncbi:MAG: hypothetical protein QOE68_1602 [Thermoanaerobaculia bacterium]|nr:hypothetical protein [Thermoanaerobaculia bacterium]
MLLRCVVGWADEPETGGDLRGRYSDYNAAVVRFVTRSMRIAMTAGRWILPPAREVEPGDERGQTQHAQEQSLDDLDRLTESPEHAQKQSGRRSQRRCHRAGRRPCAQAVRASPHVAPSPDLPSTFILMPQPRLQSALVRSGQNRSDKYVSQSRSAKGSNPAEYREHRFCSGAPSRASDRVVVAESYGLGPTLIISIPYECGRSEREMLRTNGRNSELRQVC